MKRIVLEIDEVKARAAIEGRLANTGTGEGSLRSLSTQVGWILGQRFAQLICEDNPAEFNEAMVKDGIAGVEIIRSFRPIGNFWAGLEMVGHSEGDNVREAFAIGADPDAAADIGDDAVRASAFIEDDTPRERPVDNTGDFI